MGKRRDSLKSKGSVSSYQRKRAEVFRHYHTFGEKIGYFARDYTALILGVMVLLALAKPASVWISMSVAPILLLIAFNVRPQWEMATPFVEYESPLMARAFRLLGGRKSPLVGAYFYLREKNKKLPDPFKTGRGLLYLGNELEDRGKALWVTPEMMATHMMLMGTTGGGKTQVILGMIQQLIQLGSGTIFIDGKADVTTWFYLYTMARMYGRESDLLVVNYLTAGDSSAGKRSSKNSNNTNPFQFGSSDGLMELLSGLMGEAGGNDGMWRGRAEALGRALLRALCELRDQGHLILSVDKIREHLPLERIEELRVDTRLSAFARNGIQSYLNELPGWQEPQDGGQGGDPRAQQMQQQARNKAVEQHGYLVMQFTSVLEMLSATYAHITKIDLGEVDFADVIKNRRILYVMLPAMEKSPESLKNLGRMAVTSIRNALVGPLGGDKLTGSKEFLVDARSTNAEVPFGLFCDEYGSYAVEGFGDVVAQARSLKVMACFAGQDYPSFKKGSEIEAERIDASTGLKVWLKTENKATAQLLIDRVGKAYAAVSGGIERNQNAMIDPTVMRDTGSGSYQEVDRVVLEELAAQGPGEAHIVYGDRLWRARMFYGDYKQASFSQVNSFLRVRRPSLSTEGEAPEVARERHRQAMLARVEQLKNPPEKSHLDAQEGGEQTRETMEPFFAMFDRLQQYPGRSDPLVMGPMAIMPLVEIVDGSEESLTHINSEEIPPEVIEVLKRQHTASVMMGSAKQIVNEIKEKKLSAWEDKEFQSPTETILEGMESYPEEPTPEPAEKEVFDSQISQLLSFYDTPADEHQADEVSEEAEEITEAETRSEAEAVESGSDILSEAPPTKVETAKETEDESDVFTSAAPPAMVEESDRESSQEDGNMSMSSMAEAEFTEIRYFDDVEDESLGIFANYDEADDDEDDA